MSCQGRVEFYDSQKPMGKDYICGLCSCMVPTIGSYVNIQKVNWKVVGVSYAVDNAGEPTEVGLRANVELLKCTED